MAKQVDPILAQLNKGKDKKESDPILDFLNKKKSQRNTESFSTSVQSQSSLGSELVPTIQTPKEKADELKLTWNSVSEANNNWGPTEFKQFSETTGGEDLPLPEVNPFIPSEAIPSIAASTNIPVFRDEVSELIKSYNRGVANGLTATNLSQRKPDLKRVAELQSISNKNKSEGAYRDFSDEKDLGKSMAILAENPVEILSALTLESLASQGSSVGSVDERAVATGAILGSSIPAIGTTTGAVMGASGSISLALETSSFLLDELQKKGVDVSNAEQLTQAFEDTEFINELKSEGEKRGLPVAVLDALSVGVAGKLGGKGFNKVIREMSTQSALGGGGEAGKQLVGEGEITDYKSILTEMIAEIGGGSPEIIFGILSNKPNLFKRPQESKKENVDKLSKTEKELLEAKNKAPQWAREDIQSKIDEVIDAKNKEIAEQAVNYSKLSEEDQNRIADINDRLDQIKSVSESTNLSDDAASVFKDEINTLLDEKKSIEGKTTTDVVQGTEQDIPLQTEQESQTTPLTQEAKTEITESIGKLRKVKPKNIKGLLDVMGGIFGLNKTQAESAAVVGDVMVENMAKRAGVSKDKMYQRIGFAKSTKEAIDKLSTKGKKLFQIVGENAQLGETIKENLQVARDMESSGKDTKAIRMATGWEKGKDGKWRYEILDGDIKGKAKRDTDEGYSSNFESNLNEVLDNEELFNLYPKLREIKVEFKDGENKGSYSNGKITISSDAKSKKSILIHEIQHAIQDIEGFAKGTNPQAQSLSSNVVPLSEILKFERTNKEYGSLLDKDEKGTITSEERERMSSLFKEFRDNYFKENKSQSGYQRYKKHAGEVEARNVQTRMDMTPEQRMETTLQETEDVARDEQRVLFQDAKGAMVSEDVNATIYALTDPNVSTPLHELAHVYEHYLTDTERKAIQKWAGTDTWTTETSEKFARGFEKYLSEGKAPTVSLQKAFDNFKTWLTEIYNGITNSDIDLKLNNSMRDIYDVMLVEEEKPTIIDESKPKTANESLKSVAKKFKDNKTFVQQVEEALKPFTKKRGSVTNTQAKTISKKAVNVKTQDDLDNFLEYAKKVLKNSEFISVAKKAKTNRDKARKKYNKGNLGVDNGNLLRSLRIDPSDLSFKDAKRYENMVGRMNARTYDPNSIQNIEDIEYFSNMYSLEQKSSVTREEGEVAKSNKKAAIESFEQSIKQFNEENFFSEDNAIIEDVSLLRSLTNVELDSLTTAQIIKLTEYLKTGNITNHVSVAIRKIKKNRGSDIVKKATSSKGFKNLIREYFNPINLIKGKSNKKERIKRLIRNLPLNRLDTVIRGALDVSKPLYNTLIKPISTAYSKYEGDYKNFEKTLSESMKMAYKGKNSKERAKLNVKLSLIALGKQKSENPNAEELSSVESYMEAIKEDGTKINKYKDKADLYLEVYDEMTDGDKFDWEKEYKKLSLEELTAFKLVENHFAKQAKKVEIIAARNGEGTIIYDFYSPIRVAYVSGKDLESIVTDAKKFNSNKNNVPKSPNVKKRSSSEGELVILDFFGNAMSVNRSVLRDYHLREPLRVATAILTGLKKDKSVTGDQLDFIEAIEETLSEVTENIFVNTEFQGGKFIQWLNSRGYERELVSIPRAAVELTSNVLHAVVYDPQSLLEGSKYLENYINRDMMQAANEIGTTQFTRLFLGETTARVESGAMGERPVNWWDKKMKEISSGILSKPDSSVAKRMWMGNFVREFKKETGEDFNVDQLLDNPIYKQKHKEAIKKAREKADFKLSQGFATMNPFEGIVAAQIRKDESFWKTADKYMTRFVRFEFQSSVDAINGMLGRNEISKQEATQLMAATVIRMAAYQAGLFTIQNLFYGMIESALGIEGEREEEDMEKILKRAKMSFLSTGMGLFILRRMGNLTRIPIVAAVEYLNYKKGKEYGLRDKEDFNSYEDGLIYSPAISAFKIGSDYRNWYTSLLDFGSSFAGPLNKVVKSTGRLVQNAYMGGIVNPLNTEEYLVEPSLKTKEAINRRQNRAKKDVSDLVFTSLGIPFSRDFMNLYTREVFEEYNEKKKESTNSLKTSELKGSDLKGSRLK